MKKYIYIIGIIAVIAIILISMLALNFSKKDSEPGVISKMELNSVFGDGERIPVKYTCDGEDINPLLVINGIPAETKSMALIVDDPDAPGKTWVHWVVWNIAPDTTRIEENSIPNDAVQGINDFGRKNYGGMCPPSGTHRYYFKIYALDTTLELDPDSEKPDLEGAMRGHILDQATLVGLYSRG